MTGGGRRGQPQRREGRGEKTTPIEIRHVSPLTAKRPTGRRGRMPRSIAGCGRTDRGSIDPAAAYHDVIVVKDDRLTWRDG
jgi:hypothetical protein